MVQTNFIIYASNITKTINFYNQYIIKDSCTIASQFHGQIPFCSADYNLLNEETSNFDVNWGVYNSNSSASSSSSASSRVQASFKYRSALNLNGFLYTGAYASYSGGGYVYEMRGSRAEIIGNITQLQTSNWIDRQTRAIFVEFTVYNPNINLFSYCTILFEFLPTGNIVSSYTFLPMNLFADTTEDVVVVKMAFYAVYLGFIIFFMIKEIRLVIKLKRVS